MILLGEKKKQFSSYVCTITPLSTTSKNNLPTTTSVYGGEGKRFHLFQGTPPMLDRMYSYLINYPA